MGRASKMFRFAVLVCSAALVAAEAGYTVLGYAGLNAPTAYNSPVYAANPLAAGLDHVGFGLGYDARAIASGRATGVIGGQSTLGHSSYSAFAKREAEAEPLILGNLGAGYSGLGFGHAGIDARPSAGLAQNFYPGA